MKLLVKYLRWNNQANRLEEVAPETGSGFWRIVEHVNSAFFARPALYATEDAAEKTMEKILEKEHA